MKITQSLFRENCKFSMLRFIKSQWRYQSKHKIIPTMMEKALQENNIPVYDAVDLVKEHMYTGKRENVIVPEDYRITPLVQDNTHPDWNDEPCLTYNDSNVLVEGLNQAKIFTNSFEVRGGLPSNIEDLYDKFKIDNQDELVQSTLITALAYDMTQLKLPPVKDPKKPQWVFPRSYGIPDYKCNTSVCNKLLGLCEMIVGHDTSNRRTILPDAWFQVVLKRDRNLLMRLRADLLLTADEPLKTCTPPLKHSLLSPTDMSPMNYKSSLQETNIYKMENIYPINDNTELVHLHTAFIHYNKSEVKNFYGTSVLESQTLGRSLMKSFTIAASKAVSQYGDDVKKLPVPITVQSVQTDSRNFHFNVFQLNTLEWPPVEGEHNVFWSDTMVPIYEQCGYVEAKPVLTSYNPDVFKKLLAFYANGCNLQ